MNRSHSWAEQSVALVVGLAMAISVPGAPIGVAMAATPGPSAKAAASGDRRRAAERLERLFQVIEARDKELPRDTFDPQAVVEKTGTDPAAIFGWVRDQTYFVPYRGVLRGPVGVLMDRLGNSLDRALLLADLLKRSGHEVRLAHGAVGEERAKALFQKVRPIPREGTAPPRPSREQTRTDMERYARQLQLDAVKLKARVDESFDRAERMAKDASRMAAEQARLIAVALGPRPRESSATPPGWTEALRDHWWVQRSQDSAWIDLDPTLADAKPGEKVTEAAATLAPEDLGEDLQHEVQIQVVAERWTGGRLEAAPVLTHTLIPWKLLGTGIFLSHAPTKWPADLDLTKEEDPAARLKATLLEQDDWIPVLRVGTESVQGSSVGGGGGGTGGLSRGGAVGGLLGGLSDEEDSDAKPVLTAEWIDYEIRSPGRPIHKERREIFDQLGPAARGGKEVPRPALSERQRLEQALALIGDTSVLVQSCRFSAAFDEHLAASAILQNRERLLDLARTARFDPARGDFVRPAPDVMRALASIRMLWGARRGDVYLDAPNVLSLHSYQALDAKGMLRPRVALDIVSNEVAIRPGSDVEPFTVRLEHGVLESSAEAVLGSGRSKGSAAAVLASASARTGLVALRSSKDPGWKDVKMESDVRARVRSDLNAGYVVLVPPAPVDVNGGPGHAWWRVDPRTGHALAIGDRGWGSGEMPEYAVVIKAFFVGFFNVHCIGEAVKEGPQCLPICAATIAFGFLLGGVLEFHWVFGLIGDFAPDVLEFFYLMPGCTKP